MFPYDLRRLNSATQYPSIATYHTIAEDQQGILLESGKPFAEADGTVHVTEKIDGTNGRIILFYNDGELDWIIGSRTELLASRGDRIVNNDLGIVDALRPIAEQLWDAEKAMSLSGITMFRLLQTSTDALSYTQFRDQVDSQSFTAGQDYLTAPDMATVFFFEVYGHKTHPKYKVYSDGTVTGARLFDIALIPATVIQDLSPEAVASWRDHGKQPYLTTQEQLHWASLLRLGTVPFVDTFDASTLPTTVEGGLEWLVQFGRDHTRAHLMGLEGGIPEGLVLRTHDRRIIRKMRRHSYEWTIKKRALDAKEQSRRPKTKGEAS